MGCVNPAFPMKSFENTIPKLVIAPGFVLGLAFIYGFMVWNGILSVTASRMLPNYDEFVGLEQYARLWDMDRWWLALRNLGIFSVLYVGGSMLLGMGLAIFLDQKIRVNRQTLGLLADLEKLAQAQNEVGKVTLQDVLRAQIEQDRLTTDIANLEDSRRPLLAQFKAALGLRAGQPDPPVPRQFESTPLDLSSDRLFEVALAHNPRLKAMAAEVRRAEAALGLAYKSRVPDFSAGTEVDVKAAPVMWNPQFSVTLPIWRDKIAAEIAAAQAGRRSAEARLSAEQISLAVDFAEKSFMFREASRNLALLQDQLIPKARLSLEVARSGYLSGQIDFLNLISAEQSLFGFQLDEVAARTQRELALAELSLLIAGLPPANAPVSAGKPAP